MMLTLQDALFCASLAAYMTASVFVAAVRWGHRCQPYARHMDYYHPAWKTVIFCYLSNLFMLPALFLPAEADAILQLRLLLILASPFYCAMLIFSYFGSVLQVKSWRLPMSLLAIPFAIMAVLATVLALVPGNQMDREFCWWFFSVGGMLAVVYLILFSRAMYMVARELRQRSRNNFSNPDDFPRQYASSVLWISFAHLGVSWVTTSIGTPVALSIGLVLLTALSLVFLIGVLSPHRTLEVERLEAGESPDQPLQQETILSEQRQDEIEKAIRQQVEEGKLYLDSHLLLEEVARRIGVNSKYVSRVMQARLGGFFTYVNRCRLAHAASLQAEHPEMSIGDIIADSGFGSRTTYYKIRRELSLF